MLNMLIEPFRFDFINYALIIALLVSVPCALLSVFLVLKGWALMGDAMSHAVFPGVVLAWIVGLPLGTGAFVVGLSCALLTGWICPYISRHLLSLNPLQARCRRYSRGER